MDETPRGLASVSGDVVFRNQIIGNTDAAGRDPLSRGHRDCRLDVRPSVFADRENAPKRRDQPVEFDRLGFKLVAARGDRLFALAGQGMNCALSFVIAFAIATPAASSWRTPPSRLRALPRRPWGRRAILVLPVGQEVTPYRIVVGMPRCASQQN